MTELNQAATYGALSIATMLVAGNNLSASMSTAVGSKAVSTRNAQLLGAASYALGLFLQGNNMARTVRLLLPTASQTLVLELLATTILIFLFAKAVRAPISLTMSLVGLLIGASLASGLKINGLLTTETVLMWFLTPIIAALSTFITVKVTKTRNASKPWRRLMVFRILLILLSFTSAYTLGANTLGLMVALAGFTPMALAVGVASAVLGAIILSRGEMKRVGLELYSLRYTPALVTLAMSTALVELATMIGVPLSNTQALTAGVFGAALGYRFKYIDLKPFMTIVAGWIAAPLFSLIIGYLITPLG
jgi:PiT family inorganic phosphate transporter